MENSFCVAQKLIQSIFGMTIHLLSSEEDYAHFCQAYTLHPIQQLFHVKNLRKLIDSLQEGTVFYIQDQLQINFIMFMWNAQCVILGPFCTHIFSRGDCIQLLKQLNLSINLYDSLLSYRDKFPLLSINDAFTITTSLTKVITEQEYHFQTIDYSSITEENIKSEENTLKQQYSQFIHDHYAIEQQFMHSIEQGDTENAIMYLKYQQRGFQSFKRLGTTLENERIAAAIVRTMVRIAAIQAGLPTLSIDLLSRSNTIASRKAKSVDEIYTEKEKMVMAFCNEIKKHKNQGYSSLISNVICYMEHEYDENITVAQLAEEFHISPNYLTNLFHKETGQTPTDYLRQIRTSQARQLLLTTNLPIQKISEKIGIDDSNYFVKLFKKDYAMTPSQYRKHYKL